MHGNDEGDEVERIGQKTELGEVQDGGDLGGGRWRLGSGLVARFRVSGFPGKQGAGEERGRSTRALKPQGGVRRRGRGRGHGGMVALAPCRACRYREEEGKNTETPLAPIL